MKKILGLKDFENKFKGVIIKKQKQIRIVGGSDDHRRPEKHQILI